MGISTLESFALVSFALVSFALVSFTLVFFVLVPFALVSGSHGAAPRPPKIDIKQSDEQSYKHMRNHI